MHRLLSEVAASPLFSEAESPYLLLDARLEIVAVNDAYQRATDRSAEQVVGQHMFDAFPDNPDDPAATGVHNLSASLEHVLRSQRAHDMLVQRYDVQATSAGGQFVPRLWSPVNSPIVDDPDGVVGVVHHVEDITDLRRILTDRETNWVDRDHSHRTAAVRTALLNVGRGNGNGALVRENQRLRDALTSVAASRGMFGLRNRMVDRRRQLWQQISDDAGAADWAGWTTALCHRVVSRLPGIDAAAVSVRSGPVHDLVAATAPWAHRLEQLHYTVGEGPAAAAYDTGVPVLVPDLIRHEHRWPGYVEAAADQVSGVFVIPLFLDGTPIATLSLYARTDAALTPDHWSDTMIAADLIVSALLVDLDRAPVSVNQSGTFHRVAIAAGIIAGSQETSIDQATNLLRAYAFTHNRPIFDVADDVIDGRLRLNG